MGIRLCHKKNGKDKNMVDTLLSNRVINESEELVDKFMHFFVFWTVHFQ